MVDQSIKNMSDNSPEEGKNSPRESRLEPTLHEKKEEPAPVIQKRKGPSARDLYRIPTSPLKGKYEFIQVIGAGGAGVIYKAKQNPLNRTVAIKMVHSHIVSPTSLMRFEKEAKTISTLNHPNIIAIHDFGVSEDEQPYMVMDYIEGIPLSEYIKEKEKLSLDETLDYAVQICDGLSHAHRKGILHRDLKPNNLMLLPMESGNYHVKILDFGLAKILHGDEEDERDHLTKTGETVGTPAYMSPEQVMGQSLDQRTDVYSLGCVIYHCLTGSPPFLGETKMETMLMHLNKAPEPVNDRLGEPLLEPFFDQLILKLLAKNADDRFNNLLEVKESIENGQKGLFTSYPESPAPQSQLETLKDGVYDQEKTLVDEKKQDLTPDWFAKNKTAVIIAAGVLMLGIPFFAMISNLNRSVKDDAKDNYPNLNDKEKQYREALDEALTADTYPNERFLQMLNREIDKDSNKIAVGKFKITDPALKQIHKVHNLYILDLTGAPITGKGLEYVAAVPSIHELNLSGTKIRNKDLDILKKLPGLNKLNLSKTAVTDQGAKSLASINGLITLNMDDTKISSAALPELAQSKNLDELSLAGTNVTDTNLETLQQLPALTKLNLSGCKINNNGLEKLSSLKNLTQLDLSHTELTKEGIQHLTTLKELQDLNLSGTKLDKSSIKYLLKLKALKRLQLIDCDISLEETLPLSRRFDGIIINTANLN